MSGRDGKRKQRGKEDKSAPQELPSSTNMNDDVVKDIIKGRTGEQERIQQKVFAKWINCQFAKVNNPRRIEDLFQDLRTGVNLAALVELITGTKVGVEKGKSRLHYVSNINRSLEVLEQHDVKLVSVSADDIEDGNSKLTLSLIWALIQQYYVRRLGGTVNDLRINNLEKTLLCWSQLATKGYPHVDVKNLHTSWTDGLAFNALIHKYHDDLFDYSALLNNTAEVNLLHAFDVAAKDLSVPPLLEPEDILQGTPDQKSIVTYLLCLLEALPHEAMEVKALAAVSDLDANAAGNGGGTGDNYQTSAESVLAWMLSVEEKLDRCEISDTLDQANILWHEHEALLSELSVQKNTVQHILDHGAQILKKSRGKKSKAATDVENSMTVLTEKWENLQVKSAERSKLLRKILTILQQEHIKTIDSWLVDTETRIGLLKESTSSIESMDAQLRELSKLQDDLEKQLKVMNELMHLLFVGENGDDDGIEAELFGFRRRWDDICHWTEAQWSFVRRIRETYDEFLRLCNECSDWISGRMELLQGLPTGTSDRADWIQRNVDLLREMHDQMMDYQEKIQAIQEKSDAILAYFTTQTAVGMQARKREEKICTEWNELVDHLEACTSDSNIRVERSDGLRSSKIRHSKRYSDNVDPIAPHHPTPEESQPKTKKIRQDETDEGFLENCDVLMDWLREKHRALGIESGQSKSSPVADRSVMSQIGEELSEKDAEYKSLRMLAEDIITEKRSANMAFEEIENKLNELASLWNNLTWILGAGSTSPLLDQDEENFTHNLEVLEDVLISCRKTVERFDRHKDPSPYQLEQDLDDCKDRLHLMSINEVRITETAGLVKKITDQGMSMNDIDVSWIEFCNRWHETRTLLVEQESRFSIMKENQPTRTFLAEVDALKAWTNQLHTHLMEEQALHPTYLDKMVEQLDHYRDIQRAVDIRQPSLERANSPPRQIVDKLIGTSYQKELIDLNAEWKDILQYLQHNSDDLNKWCEDMKAFEIDTEGLKQWMAEVDSFLNIDIDTVTDFKAFAELQEQFQGLEADIKVLAPTAEKLLEAGRVFLKTNQEDFAASVNGSLKEIEDHWTSVCTRAARQLQNLSVSGAQRRLKAGQISPEAEQLHRIRASLPTGPIDSIVALEEAIEVVRTSKQRLLEIRHSVTNSSSQAQDAISLTILDVEEECRSMETRLKNFVEKWTILSGCLTACHSWMDEMETLLLDIENKEDDASKHREVTKLNDLMATQDSDNFATVAELAEEFTQSHVLKPLVEVEVDKMRNRLSRLSKRVTGQQNTPVRSDSRSSDVDDSAIGNTVSAHFSQRIDRVTNFLADLQSKLHSIELKTFESIVIKCQLDDCLVLFKKLSEIKGEVESLIKQGCTLVEADPLKPDNEGFSVQLDKMKAQYNQIVAQVTATKADLDPALKLVEKAEKDVDSLRMTLDDMEAALAELEKFTDLDEFDDASKDLKASIKDHEEDVNEIRVSHQQLRKLAMKPTVPGFESKYSQQMQRWNKAQARARTLQSPNKENRSPAPVGVIQDLSSRNGLAAARSEFFGQSVKPGEAVHVTRSTIVLGSSNTVARQTSTTITTTTTTTSEGTISNAAVTDISQAKLLPHYQAALRREMNKIREELNRSRSEGLKAEKSDRRDLASQVDRLELRLDAVTRLDGMLQKFDTECSRIEKNIDKLIHTFPSVKDVDKLSADLEAGKHDAMINGALQNDILKTIDVAVEEGNFTATPVGDSHLPNLRSAITERWTGISHGLGNAEQSVNAVRDFYRLLTEDFVIWLPKAESVASHLQDDGTTESDPRFKRLTEERDARIASYDAIIYSGNKILSTLSEASESSALKVQLDSVAQRWRNLNAKISAIRDTSRPSDVESYLVSLDDSIKWVMRKKEELTTMQPSGDRAILQKMHNYQQLLRGKMEAERPKIDAILQRGRDLISSGDHGKTNNFEMAQLSEKVKMLSESWQSLFKESDALQLRTESVSSELDSLLKLCDSVRQKTEDILAESNKWEDTDDLSVDDLAKKVEETKKFKMRVEAQGARFEELNSLAARLQRTPGGLSEEVVRAVADLNDQKQAFFDKADHRLAQLQAGLDDVSSSDKQHFLATSVDEPWERRVGPNRVPYYINHADQITQWDHPRLMDIMSSLLEVNKIRFSAYRTATKLRLMQKKLHLDLLQLATAIEIFDDCDLRAKNDNTLDCTQAVECLMAVYKRLNSQHPNRINFALAIDVALNWLLNCHDPERTGQLRVLAFKVSIVVLCQGELNAKYRYLFRLISDENGRADQFHVGQLLYSFVQIPRYLGEVAAFGGTDVDPSVVSCFQFSTNGFDIQTKQFLAWLAKEPQALAWFSVLHRLIAAEPSRHEVKCNICESFPILGLRYRCLKCFNFDVCQNCFFTGQRSKSHKLSHPMQEYIFPATSSEDMRDFRRVLKNKLRPRESMRESSRKLAYLPVQAGGGRVVDHEKSGTLTSLNSNAKGSVGSNDPADFTQTRIIEGELSHGASSPDGDDDHNTSGRSFGIFNGTTDSALSTVEVLQAVEQEEKQEREEYYRHLQNEKTRLLAELESVKSQTAQVTEELSIDDMQEEARMLREDKVRLEERLGVLGKHNRELEAQHQRIKHLLEEDARLGNSPASGSFTYNNGPSSMNSSSSIAKQSVRQQNTSNSVNQLFHAAGSINVAVTSLVTVMTESNGEDEIDSNVRGVNGNTSLTSQLQQ